MEGIEVGNLIPEEIKKGNLVLFDHKEGRKEPCLAGTVESISDRKIYFTSGMVRKIEFCAPIPLNEKWLVKYGVKQGSLPTEIKYLHQLQNYLGNEPINNQTECMSCGSPWGWNDKNVFDFNISTGKRIWVAVCTNCRTTLERKYK